MEKAKSGSAVVYRKWVTPPYRLAPGTLIELRDPRGEPVACGLWEPEGPVAVRVLARGECGWRDPSEALRDRLQASFAARRAAGLVETGSYRLVNSDGDYLSGLIVDVFGGEIAVLQSSSLAMDYHVEEIADSIVELAGVDTVYEKSTQRSRRDRGLEPRRRWIRGSKSRTIHEEWGARFVVDVVRGQKTGFYLDQRFNRLEFMRLAGEGDRVLDVFSYTGGFGILAALAGAREVVFIEEDPVAVELLRENLRLNGVGNYRIIHGSVWDVEGVPPGYFTLVAVDPPAFIQSGDPGAVRRGVGAYRRVYRWSVSRAVRGARVYLSSCSYFLSRDLFLDVVNSSVGDYRILGSLRGAAPDHVFRGEEYLDYLKGVFLYLG
ncbi:MAG: class I SAM-dependent rRNA methyltransferase [Desulfurococcales archaeon]|nr:class I SAM-dependent rRNA methyltransferase [Desulfurococcales archaeon]